MKRTLLFLVLLSACAPAVRTGPAAPMVLERLYLGRNIGDTLGVTDSAWAVFVREVIVTRLPEGFTYWSAEGGWRGADGRTIREPSYVLEVIHPKGAAAIDSAVVQVIAEYKRRFRQEAVLRVATSGTASY